MIESSKEKKKSTQVQKSSGNKNSGQYEEGIRPSKLDEIIGRVTEKETLKIMIKSARRRK